MIARIADGLPLAASMQENEDVSFVHNTDRTLSCFRRINLCRGIKPG